MIPLIAVSDYLPWGDGGAGPPRVNPLVVPEAPPPPPPDLMEDVRFVNIYATTNPSFPWFTSKNILLTAFGCIIGVIQWRLLCVYLGVDLFEIVRMQQFFEILKHLYIRRILQKLVVYSREIIGSCVASLMRYCAENEYTSAYSMLYKVSLYWFYKDVLSLLTGFVFLFSADIIYQYFIAQILTLIT